MNTIVIRQDTKLFTYKVKTGKLDKSLDMDEYQAVPCIVFDNKFYELENERIVVVELDSMYQTEQNYAQELQFKMTELNWFSSPEKCKIFFYQDLQLYYIDIRYGEVMQVNKRPENTRLKMKECHIERLARPCLIPVEDDSLLMIGNKVAARY